MSERLNTLWGVSVPQHFTQGPVDRSLITEFAGRAEDLGYDSLWVQERVVSDFPVLEPVSLLCYLAGVTSKVRLGSSVLISPLRNPMNLARVLATADQLSGGRLIVGVGLGNAGRDYPALGVPVERRVSRFIEGIELMKAVWVQPSVTHKGDFWQLNNFQMEPKPAQKPHPPIWFGAHLPAALKRAVRYGNGWMGAGNSSTADFKDQAPKVRAYLDEAGRDPATFTISKRVYIAVAQDGSLAKGHLENFFGVVYGNPERGPKLGVWGTVDQCVEGLREVLLMEPDLVLLTPVFDHIAQMEILAHEVIPKLR